MTIDRLLAQRARTHAGTPFLRFASGDHSYAEVDVAATRLAHALVAEAGVRPGDRVASILPTGLEAALLPFAVARCGAVHVPVNTAFRGRVLEHVLEITAPRVVLRPGELPDGADETPIPSPNAPDDLAMLLFTSGTTGRSKGCMLSHRYGPRQAELLIEHLGLRPDDVLYCPFPLFHLDGLVLTVFAALRLGTTAALGERFSVSGFWGEVRAMGATVFDFMGATLTMLHRRPPAPGDGDNPARLAWGVPVPDWAPDFEARFGLRLVELYGSTDVGLPIFQPLDEPRVPGSCGRPIGAYEVRLVARDQITEVAPGEVGEIAVRPREPGLISAGYYGMPGETAASRRDGWFFTGDLATRDAAGNVFFVGRTKDAIRRRGENISAFEVEEVVLEHPDVVDAAAFGVPSPLGEEDVMVCVVPRPGSGLEPAELAAHCERGMARYMVPRYIDVVDALPRTPTEKVEKYRLAERGVTPTTWDREGPDPDHSGEVASG